MAVVLFLAQGPWVWAEHTWTLTLNLVLPYPEHFWGGRHWVHPSIA